MHSDTKQTTEHPGWAKVEAVEREIRLMAFASAGDPKRLDDMKMYAIWAGRLQKAIMESTKLTDAPTTATRFPVPIGESVLVWAGACALAEHRHPNARYPQPSDVEFARIVLLAAASIDRNVSPTHG